MGTFTVKVGDIVSANLQFTDLSGAKRRPALVLAKVSHGDVVVCAITSQTHSNKFKVKIAGLDTQRAGLDRVSYVQTDKFFTASPKTFNKKLGTFSSEIMQQIWQKLSAVFPEALGKKK